VSRRKRMLGDLDRDIHDHIARETQDNIDRGMPPEEARYAALRKFGNVRRVKEDTREIWSFLWLEQLLQDVRFGLRTLRKSPGFTAVAVLTLALGIGANTAIFSLIDAVMLRSLPVRDPQQLLVLRWSALHDPNQNMSYSWGGCPGSSLDPSNDPPSDCVFSYPMYEQIHSRQDVFSQVSAFAGEQQYHLTADGRVTMSTAYLVSADFFTTLGARVSLGRALDSSDDKPEAPGVVMLSHAYWQRRFAGDPSIVGKSILIENRPFTVVGVVAPGFTGIDPGLHTDIWVPLAAQDRISPLLPKRNAPNSVWIEIVARLRPGISPAQAQSALTVMYANATTKGPTAIFKPEDSPRVELKSIARGMTTLRSEFSVPLFVLMVAVGIILLIACANVGGLSLARATSRRREVAMRFALGASRGRIVRQLLTESLLVSVAGAALGILLAYWSADALGAFLASNYFEPMELNILPDTAVLAFTITVTALAAILFGLAPALQGLRVDLAPALKGTSKKSSSLLGERRLGLGGLLVIGQVALSVVVLSGAGLLVHTLMKLRATDVGFRADNVLLFSVDMSMEGYAVFNDPRVYPQNRELEARFSALPGVTSAGYSMIPLLSGSNMTNEFVLPGAPDKSAVASGELPVGPGFFETMQIPLLAGRIFTPADFESSAKPEPVVVNRGFAQKLFGSENPVGRVLAEKGARTARFEIVGIVRDAKYDSLRKDFTPTIYTMDKVSGAAFEIRTIGNPKALIPLVRDVVRRVNGNLLISRIKTQSEQIDQLLYEERLVAALSALFGALALLLDCVGLYGLLAYEVARRTREIGIRMALGAQQREVLRLFIKRGCALVACGALIGLAAAFALTRYIESMLYGVKPTDATTFVFVTALLMIVALAACWIPARRATRVDPMIALRHE
jgi:macrolide transport system ATP-binding/permease protein